jgi:hypothetical protein
MNSQELIFNKNRLIANFIQNDCKYPPNTFQAQAYKQPVLLAYQDPISQYRLNVRFYR